MLLKCTQTVQSHVQKNLSLAIIGMETQGRDLDGRPSGLRMSWLAHLTVVKSQKRTDFKLTKRRWMTPQSMNRNMSLRK